MVFSGFPVFKGLAFCQWQLCLPRFLTATSWRAGPPFTHSSFIRWSLKCLVSTSCCTDLTRSVCARIMCHYQSTHHCILHGTKVFHGCSSPCSLFWLSRQLKRRTLRVQSSCLTINPLNSHRVGFCLGYFISVRVNWINLGFSLVMYNSSGWLVLFCTGYKGYGFVYRSASQTGDRWGRTNRRTF